MRSDLSSGTVTFLFTDVEGSTTLLEELGDEAYEAALAAHRVIVRAACSARGGAEVDTQGDAFFFAFPDAREAVAAAEATTADLASGPIKVRIGVHTGAARLGAEGYVGREVHFAARVAATGHGGQIVLSQATRDVLDALEFTDLGEHRLKDIPEPVAIYQLGSERFPPLKTISNTNLPRPASCFVGRETELAEVLAKVERGARLLTLTGPGGSGKTRLALEAAASLVPVYKAGVFWVGLAALRDPALVTETVSQTLGAKDGLAEHIGERELCLLLDNLEQVVACAPELAALVQTCPNLTLLCTSRELLRVQGEVEYEVPPLASLEAVSLFCARSGLDSSDEISELCAHLDNLPLAVELAAARTKALTPAQILERLSSRLDLLKGGRDADPRHQTLRATIEWSYDLLSDEEQRLFRALSIFAGGCTLEAAEEVADADLDTLQSLVEKSLLRFSKGRYWMLETIREYGIDQLVESDELDPLGQRHSQYFLELAVASEPELWAQKTDAWLPRLDPEQANFRAALGRAIGHADAEAAVALAGCLYPYWEIRARQGEARAWLTRALALEGNVPTASRAKALIAAGRAATWHSDWSAAVELLEEAAEACRELGDVAGVGRCLGFIGHYRLFTGDPEGAAVALDEGVQLARSSGDRQSLARALSNAAWSPLEAGDFDGARRMWEEGAALARIEGMKPALALCLIHVGYAEVLAGRVEQASSALSEGTALFDELGGTTWTPVAHRYLGLAALLSGQLDRAEDLLRTSLQAGKEEAPQFHLLYWIEALAAVAAGKGQTERAATLWGATYALFDELRLVALQENRQVRDRYKNHVRAAIDQAPQAWTRGRAMTLREAVSYALREDDGEDAAATID